MVLKLLFWGPLDWIGGMRMSFMCEVDIEEQKTFMGWDRALFKSLLIWEFCLVSSIGM